MASFVQPTRGGALVDRSCGSHGEAASAHAHWGGGGGRVGVGLCVYVRLDLCTNAHWEEGGRGHVCTCVLELHTNAHWGKGGSVGVGACAREFWSFTPTRHRLCADCSFVQICQGQS